MVILDASTFVAGIVAHELLLFAAIFFLIGGIDDLLIDLIWIARAFYRRLFVFTRHRRTNLATLPPAKPGWIAVFVPAWQEAEVIGQMLRTALSRFDHPAYRLYVGVYPNDHETMQIVGAVAAQDDRVCMVVNAKPGPTTKADCLNSLWRRMLHDERVGGIRVKAVAFHDAEDVVHSGELRIFDTLIERFDLVQLPVLPLVNPKSRWISGHYVDEFAESHGKGLIVREALGAAVPSAGVGCAFSREALMKIAQQKGGVPFEEDSLTEDYELGLRIAEMGGRGVFVSLPTEKGGAPVAIREHFPATFEDAVTQKARWMAGIALSGWDRLGWKGGFAERWMRLRDRRGPFSGVVLFAGYIGLLALGVHWLLILITDAPRPVLGPWMQFFLLANSALVTWRMVMRFGFVTKAYGWRQGLRAVPRAVVANIIAMFAARRAVKRYLLSRKNGQVVWDKTTHMFPDTVPAE